MKEGAAAGPAPQFVKQDPSPALPAAPPARARSPRGSQAGASGPAGGHSASEQPVYDVIVAGGTLGVFVAASLATRGWRVAVVERGALRGRAQEWNISRKEMMELVELGLLTREELEGVIAMEFNPVRVGFHGAGEVWTRDVLNCGVSPDALITLMRAKLEAAGGRVYERVDLAGVTVHPDAVVLSLRSDPTATHLVYGSTIKGRLLVDCMGHASPIVRQARWGRKPDGVCMVVGTLGSGYTTNSTADVIATATHLQPDSARVNKMQFFWEAFPAGSGPTDRTTYMFAYMDAAPWRPSLEAVFDEYWPLLEGYQAVRLRDISFKRALFGLFPTYRDSPLRPGWDRVLQVGDASGIQSPLSFGGFGALTRHLGRLTRALAEALAADALDAQALGAVHAYNPGLSSAWMLQKAMSVRQGDRPPPDLINRMLGGNFKAMQGLGDPVMKPFLQDVIQFGPLLRTMGAQMLHDPASVPQLLAHVGPAALADWVLHVGGLGAATALHAVTRPLRPLVPSPAPKAQAPGAGGHHAGGSAHQGKSGSSSASGSRAGVSAAPTGPLTARQAYFVNRLLDAIEFGAGADYKL